jgi:hypothetical protein
MEIKLMASKQAMLPSRRFCDALLLALINVSLLRIFYAAAEFAASAIG